MKPGFYQQLLNSTLYYRKKIGKNISGIILYTGLLTTCVLVYDMGFGQDITEESFLRTFYRGVKWVLFTCFLVRNILNIFNRDKKASVKFVDAVILVGLLILLRLFVKGSFLYEWLAYLPSYKYVVGPAFITIFFIEFSRNAVGYYSRRLNPALIFLLSFFFIIVIGAFLLSLPNAAYERLSLVDALFTSASAVCVTGLIVLDTATGFTGLGKIIILMLIQIGGLGIMTFAGFIGFMFSGAGVSFQQRLMLREIGNSERINEVIHAIYKIVLIMVLVESIGALAIYLLTPDRLFPDWEQHIFFSVFHSISAFCNAGFSTFTEGLHDVELRFNYLLLVVLGLLVITGGIGFPIMLNFYTYLKLQAMNIWHYVVHGRRFKHVPYILNLNSKIILGTTGFLIVTGLISFFIFEYNGTLSEHGLGGKLAMSFFSAVTPRTAGFNAVEMGALAFPTVILFIFLMWIGASPGGTGGGVKTTTFALMVLNFWNIAKGDRQLILNNRAIKSNAINRAFAIVMMSLLLVGLATSLVLYFDPQFDLEQVAFEVFSAFSTTGLSLGITAGLSDESKLVLILMMFIGRVGSLTFLSAFIFRRTFKGVRIPTNEIQF